MATIESGHMELELYVARFFEKIKKKFRKKNFEIENYEIY
jgi:hypothetical protein